MGDVEERLVKDLLRDGMPLPEHIQNAPELTHGLVLYYNAFQDLSSCRSLGMSLGPIPWTAIDQYCQRHGIKDEQYDDMFHHVNELDEAYRAHVEAEAKKKGTK